MANEDNVSKTDIVSVYDYTCTLCDEDDIITEAEYYCKKCCKQYCSTCQQVHRKAHRQHSVLDRTEVEDWGAVSADLGVEVCPEHDGKEIEMYCVDDDQLCCSVCMSLMHRSCKLVQHLPDAAKGIVERTELKALIIQATIIKTKLDELIDKKERNLQQLRGHCNKILNDIESLRENINCLLDQMETRTIEELDKVLGAMDDVLHSDVTSCKTMKDDMQKLLYEIEERRNLSESLTFIAYKRCEQKLSDARCLLKSIPESEFKVTVKEYSEILSYLETLNALGEFEAKPWVPSLPPIRIGRNHIYKKVGEGRQYDVRLNVDRNTCAIVGCCKFSNELLLLADCDNKKLKLLNDLYQVIHHYETKGSPYHMCHLGGKQVAVSVDEDYSDRVYIVEVVRNRLVLNRKFGLNHTACGLAYSDGKLLVGSDTAIYVYTTNGKFVQKIFEDRSGASTVWRFAVGDQTRKLYVPNVSGNQLHILDNYGNKLTTFKEAGMKSPEAVAVAVNGNVFVCGGVSNNVIQLDRDGKKKLSKVVDAKDGVVSPRSLWFHNKSAELIIGQWNDSIVVFQLY